MSIGAEEKVGSAQVVHVARIGSVHCTPRLNKEQGIESDAQGDMPPENSRGWL